MFNFLYHEFALRHLDFWTLCHDTRFFKSNEPFFEKLTLFIVNKVNILPS
jgi:hypothetical protein